jgi:hypothetical protein
VSQRPYLLSTEIICEESENKLPNDRSSGSSDLDCRILRGGEFAGCREVHVSDHHICEIYSKDVVCVGVKSGTSDEDGSKSSAEFLRKVKT